MTKAVFVLLIFLALISVLFSFSPIFAQSSFSPSKTYKDSTASNQDDMAIWVHPSDKAKSLIIGSDKVNGNVYVYDLSGTTLQIVSDTGGQPGNIDVRYNFSLSGQLVDITAFNDRSKGIIRVFKIDPNSRTLTRIDSGSITTSPATPNYGFGLYYNKTSQKFYALTTKNGGGPVVQIELKDAGGGKIGGSIVKNWTYTSQTEGIVGDDENGFVFLAEEKKPIHKVNCQTGICDPNSAVNIDGGFLNSDVEGITLYRTGDNKGYLLSSSQGASEFEIYDRLSPHAHKGMFKISGASSTDGIDVTSVNLGSIFPQGVFLAHDGGSGILATAWTTIAQNFALTTDTNWNPRGTANLTPIPTQPTTPGQPTNTPMPPNASPTRQPTKLPARPVCIFWKGAGASQPTSTPGSFTPTPTRTPTPRGPTPTTPPTPQGGGIWISKEELAQRPMSGAAWINVKSSADASWGSADLSNQDSHHPQAVLAGAIVYVRTGQTAYKDKVFSGLRSIIGTEAGARSLALGRNLAAYAVAADLVSYQETNFKNFLSGIRRRVNSEGRSLVTCHEIRPNNWGTMCGASRIAIDVYLGDQSDLERAAKVFKGYLGDRSSYAGFIFQSGAFTWMCDPANPRPVNPAGCSKNSHDLSGAPVDDVQRGGNYTWPPNPTNYAWGGFSAAVAQAEMLSRAGYPAYDWENQAIRRGMNFLETAMISSGHNSTDWMPWVVKYHYGANFQVKTLTGWGRLMGWADWTHAK